MSNSVYCIIVKVSHNTKMSIFLVVAAIGTVALSTASPLESDNRREIHKQHNPDNTRLAPANPSPNEITSTTSNHVYVTVFSVLEGYKPPTDACTPSTTVSTDTATSKVSHVTYTNPKSNADVTVLTDCIVTRKQAAPLNQWILPCWLSPPRIVYDTLANITNPSKPLTPGDIHVFSANNTFHVMIGFFVIDDPISRYDKPDIRIYTRIYESRTLYVPTFQYTFMDWVHAYVEDTSMYPTNLNDYSEQDGFFTDVFARFGREEV